MIEELSWTDLRVFLEVAKCGSFSDAAVQLGVGQPTVSRRIAGLEERLGCALFHRGRRGTALTRQGEKMLPAAEQMARWASEAASVAQEESEVRGLVTIAAPPGVSATWLTPFAMELRSRHPDLRLSLRAGIDYVDLARGEADLAIRELPSTEPSLVTLASLTTPIAVYAASSYAERVGEGVELGEVDWICWSSPYLHLSPRPELEALIPGFAPALESDDFLVQLRACELGMGAMILPALDEVPATQEKLVRLEVRGLPRTRTHSHLVCARSVRHVPRVRAVITAFLEIFEALGTGAEGEI